MFKKMLFGFLVALLSAGAWASPITYQYWGEASGSLAGRAFAKERFTVTALADTSTVGPWCCSSRQNTSSSASITLGSLGTFDFLIPTQTWWDDNCCMGFGKNLNSNLLTLAVPGGVFDLASNYGPFFDPIGSTNGQFVNIATSGGALTLSALTAGLNFQAITRSSTVPEPASLALASLALLGLGMARRRKPC